MENTVCHGCTKKKCPQRVESFWTDREGNIKQIIDCAPKRTIIMLQELTNRQFSQQSAIESMRNELDRFSGQVELFSNLVNKRTLSPNDELQPLPNRQLQHRDGQEPAPVADTR